VPVAPVAGRWTRVGGLRVFYREVGPDPDAGSVPTLVHIHGFAISGRYLMPTAERLSGKYRNLVPDLPGYGRSADPRRTLAIPALAEATLGFLDAVGVGRATVVGNSMGCPVSCEIVRLAPERIDRAVLVSPAGGWHNQPLLRAIGQLAVDGLREPPGLARIAVPDYLRFGPVNTLRLFRAMSDYPTLERFLALSRPTLAVIGSRDRLVPGRARVEQVAGVAPDHLSLVVILGGAHALNFSHPGELANVISSWLEDREIVDDPDQPGESSVRRVGASRPA
jgi:pimeloyl-ACP methyl ester carboxylesterase